MATSLAGLNPLRFFYVGYLEDKVLPLRFFYVGYLEDKVFATPPQNIDMLRQRIIDEFNALRQQPEIPEMIRNAVRHMHKRTILCVERNGKHVEGHGP